MRNEFEENDYEYDTAVDALLAFLDLLPKDKVKMIDFDRYKTMMQTAAELKDILCENHEEGQLDIDICEMFNMGSITAQLSDLTVCNIVCYYRLAVEDQPLDDEGWLATGDLGVLLPDGYLKLVGRAKDLIIRGGENISPGEVANAVAQLDGVADVKIIGIPHEVLGEEVAAVIVLKDGAIFDEKSAKAKLAESLAKYKIPAYFVTVERFPLLGSGKVDAITLKKEILVKLGK